MTSQTTTVIFGIPIPSSNPIFLSIVAIHVLFGLAAVIIGAVAMLTNKGRGRHSNRSYLFLVPVWHFYHHECFGVHALARGLRPIFLRGTFVRVRMARPQHFAASMAPMAPSTSHAYGCVLHFNDYGVLRR